MTSRIAAALLAFTLGIFAAPEAIGQQVFNHGTLEAPAQQAQPRVQRDLRGNTVLSQRTPRFLVEAVSFKALDETGSTNLASDEIVVMVFTNGSVMTSDVYGSIDVNNTQAIRPAERCISPAYDPDQTRNHQWACRDGGAAGPVRFSVSLYEHDGRWAPGSGHCSDRTATDLFDQRWRACALQEAESFEIGEWRVEMSVQEMVEAMRQPGAHIERTITIGGYCPQQFGVCGEAADGEYEFTYRITRMSDLTGPPANERGPRSPGVIY